MPTYQYACTACGHQLEAVQSFTDEPLRDCPSCTGRLRKVFNSVGIVFKGSGFYRTDSRSGQGGGPANGSSAPSSDKPAEKKDAAASAGGGKTDSGGSSSSSSGGTSTSGGSAKAPAAAGSANS
ncbi:putative FmdB family regulatory protein [Micromonospora sp. Llam0]|uniref:FmdB family zinc ribbon protein n=1 Tax=Micromonospora sp. Llam0 TaxID=2485143 RepID=UPI000F467E1C|nr:FmdB family zinc ribbon protein [Micromonospora sp. Llam0]ROO51295.1 putative FmdB family regulatory protein [Micromonospora sp. Llam0]